MPSVAAVIGEDAAAMRLDGKLAEGEAKTGEPRADCAEAPCGSNERSSTTATAPTAIGRHAFQHWFLQVQLRRTDAKFPVTRTPGRRLSPWPENAREWS
jgi:hypothetical protein